MRIDLRPALVLPVTLATLSLATLSAAAAAGPPVARFDSAELPALARQVPVGGTLRLEGVDLRGSKQRMTLELERFEVFTGDARIVVHGEHGEARLAVPDNVYFRGTIPGEPGSSVFLTALASGGLRGFAASGGEYWVMAAATGGLHSPTLVLRKIDAATELAEQTGQFSCGSGELGSYDGARLLEDLAGAKSAVSGAVAAKATASYTARVAVETDYEFRLRFGSNQEAVDYVGDLFAFVSGIYAAEVDTTLMVSHLSLWTTSADPWTQTSPTCSLFEFGRYWNDNRGHVERTIAHYLSGKSNGGGVAWVGVLCSGGFNIQGVSSACPELTPDRDNYGGAYGYSGSISGSFDIDHPTAVWDVIAVSHEIGHNFNSPHTHCYGGLGGQSEPVDECYSATCGSESCFCGTPSLPCGQTGAGCGTIMSYCHLLSGGLANVSLTFGAGHPYGVEPNRVPDRMAEHVVSRAGVLPGCLAYEEPDYVFVDGFESGDVTAWSLQ